MFGKTSSRLCALVLFFLGAGLEPAFSLSVLWRYQKPLAYQFAYPRIFFISQKLTQNTRLERVSSDLQSEALPCYANSGKVKIAPDVFSAEPYTDISLSCSFKLLSQSLVYLILVNVHFQRAYNKKVTLLTAV